MQRWKRLDGQKIIFDESPLFIDYSADKTLYVCRLKFRNKNLIKKAYFILYCFLFTLSLQPQTKEKLKWYISLIINNFNSYEQKDYYSGLWFTNNSAHRQKSEGLEYLL